METVLFSTNGHLRTLINKHIVKKCIVYKSFTNFVNSNSNINNIDLIILDDSPLYDKKLILEKLILMDLNCSIICMISSKNQKLHIFSNKLVFAPKPMNSFILEQAIKAINITNTEKLNTKATHFNSLLVGHSDKMNKVRNELEIISKRHFPTLIFGETGVGKELAANILHNNSDLNNSDMVCVNCSELNSPIADSILFGHDKGSYTGATNLEEGLVHYANNTTFFLDEIENLNTLSQAKMLRLLENGEYRRVGSQKTYKSDFRLVTASNCNLQELIKTNNFRKDFYYRISQFTVTIPPLREHKEDIEDLVNHYFKKVNEERPIDNKLYSFLMKYNFPGNVRELNAILERSRAFSNGSKISLHM